MLDLPSCRSVLAFFAHPDDETLAAGATISKLSREGTEVHVALPATGVHSRRAQQDEATRDGTLEALRADCQQAMKILGISPDQLHLGEFPDNEMDSGSLLGVVHWVEEVIARVHPEVVLTHHRYCTNVDHRYCHEAAVVATRPSTDRHIPLLCAEVPSSTGYLRPVQWEPNLYVEVSREDVEAKIAAMESYKDEARPDPHPRSPEVLRALAKVRGSESGFGFAEAFMVHRLFG